MIFNSISIPNLFWSPHSYFQLSAGHYTWICTTNPLACSKTNLSSPTLCHVLLSLYFYLIENNCYPHSDLCLKCGSRNLAWPQTYLICHQIKWILLLKHLSYWTSFPLSKYSSSQPCSILYYSVSLFSNALLRFTG